METVKNAARKTVCRIDKTRRIVEIVKSGYTTIIRFFENGRVEIINTSDRIA